MKALWIIVLIILFDQGCNNRIIPADPDSKSVLSASQVVDSIKFTLAVQSQTFGVHDTLKATYTLLSQASAPRTFTFGYAEQIQWSLVRDSGSVVMFEPMYPSPVNTQLTLNGGQTKIYPIIRAIRDDWGAPVLPGKYNLFASLKNARSAQLTLPIVLE